MSPSIIHHETTTRNTVNVKLNKVTPAHEQEYHSLAISYTSIQGWIVILI